MQQQREVCRGGRREAQLQHNATGDVLRMGRRRREKELVMQLALLEASIVRFLTFIWDFWLGLSHLALIAALRVFAASALS